MNWLLSHYEADVSIIVVSFNTRAVVEHTLATLLASEQKSRVEVILVDNHSLDGTPEMVRDKFPSVVLARNRVNLGHSGGCNQGMRLAKGRHLFCLNSDGLLRSGALDSLVRYLDEHPEVGAAAPKVLNADGTIQGTIKSFPTPSAALFGRYSVLTRLFPNNRWSRRYLVYLDRDFSRPFRCDSASACALMFSRPALQAAGAFDERFFLYWNDVDLCKAIWSAGFEVHCVPDAIVVHDQHKGGTRAGFRRLLTSTVDFHKGAYRYYRKWHVRRPWSPKTLVVVAVLSLRAGALIVVEALRWAFSVDVHEMSGKKETLRERAH
jgi:GT2 family glycosyltransferase